MSQSDTTRSRRPAATGESLIGVREPIVFRYGRVGDTILLAPLLHLLHRRYGRPCTLVATGAWPGEIYREHPDVGRVLGLAHRHRPLALSPQRWNLVRTLRGRAFDPVYVAETEPRALAKIRRLLALARVGRERCVFLVDVPAAHDEHWVDRLLRFGGATPAALHGRLFEATTDEDAPNLHLTDADRADAAAWLRTRGYAGRPLFLLQPANKRTMRWNGVRAAADDDKHWPLESWSRIAAMLALAQRDGVVLLCGSASERPLLAAIAARAGARNVAVAADLPLRRLFAVAARANGMVSVDTGPAHLAAAAGCPLVVLYGASSPANWRPRSPRGTPVVTLGGPPASRRVDAITVEAVAAAARQAFLDT